MAALTELAERLGRAIAESPQAQALRQARRELAADKEVTALLDQFRKQAQKISQTEEEGKPVEVADKHALTELQQKLAGSDLFKRFTIAQMEYVDVMRKVNQAIEKQLQAVEGDSAA